MVSFVMALVLKALVSEGSASVQPSKKHTFVLRPQEGPGGLTGERTLGVSYANL